MVGAAALRNALTSFDARGGAARDRRPQVVALLEKELGGRAAAGSPAETPPPVARRVGRRDDPDPEFPSCSPNWPRKSRRQPTSATPDWPCGISNRSVPTRWCSCAEDLGGADQAPRPLAGLRTLFEQDVRYAPRSWPSGTADCAHPHGTLRLGTMALGAGGDMRRRAAFRDDPAALGRSWTRCR